MPGKDIGYVRVSTHDQNTARQLDGVHLDKVFEEHVSGKNSDRPALQTCLDYVRDGDTLHVHSIDRLARNLQDLLTIVTTLKEKGVTVTSTRKSSSLSAMAQRGKAMPSRSFNCTSSPQSLSLNER